MDGCQSWVLLTVNSIIQLVPVSSQLNCINGEDSMLTTRLTPGKSFQKEGKTETILCYKLKWDCIPSKETATDWHFASALLRGDVEHSISSLKDKLIFTSNQSTTVAGLVFFTTLNL